MSEPEQATDAEAGMQRAQSSRGQHCVTMLGALAPAVGADVSKAFHSSRYSPSICALQRPRRRQRDPLARCPAVMPSCQQDCCSSLTHSKSVTALAVVCG